jgi:hypothetical protein
MHREPEQLLARRDSLATRIHPRDVGADVNIANDRATASPARKAERDDVSRAAVPEVFQVHSRYCSATNERD